MGSSLRTYLLIGFASSHLSGKSAENTLGTHSSEAHPSVISLSAVDRLLHDN